MIIFALPPILAAVLCLIINRQRIGTKQMPELKAKENLTKLMIGLIISAAVVAAGLLLENSATSFSEAQWNRLCSC